MNTWQIIYEAREIADRTAADGNWQDVVDTEIERLADSPEIADAAIEANNVAMFRAAGVI
jgi:hypothetical protein